MWRFLCPCILFHFDNNIFEDRRIWMNYICSHRSYLLIYMNIFNIPLRVNTYKIIHVWIRYLYTNLCQIHTGNLHVYSCLYDSYSDTCVCTNKELYESNVE